MIWPMLRTLPNNTHASLMQRYAIDYPSLLTINGMTLKNEKVNAIKLDGTLSVISHFKDPGIELTRVIFPSVDKPMLCERYTIRNTSQKPLSVNVPQIQNNYKTDPKQGKDGSYTVVNAIAEDESRLHVLQPGAEFSFYATLQAFKNGQQQLNVNVQKEEEARIHLVKNLQTNLALRSPDSVLNTAFNFAKLRASESIFNTAGGLLHSPGGEAYYAAIWANDQAEYVNPFFPFLGYETGDQAALNAFRHFARYMNDSYKPLPSSIIAEGQDIWNGAGDRGDAAMIAYGAARYALALGRVAEAQELWPLITWCLEYCKRKVNSEGVVASDADELERRFPAGDANLCTSSLYYDALISAYHLGKELKLEKSKVNAYLQEATTLRNAIERYFGAQVGGFETYRYYKGNELLRSWICIPLTVGIYERAKGTIAALFSDKLWSDNGLLTQEGNSTYWDRSTLYALRGVYEAGYADLATQRLAYYSKIRLLGEHVPYPIEAYPEGNQRHLAAESGLYCRIITEGLFGIRPTGFNSFTLTPQLPSKWNTMALKNIRAFGSTFSIDVDRLPNEKIRIMITKENSKPIELIDRNGHPVEVKFKSL